MKSRFHYLHFVLCALIVIVFAFSMSACGEKVRDLEAEIPLPTEMKQSTPEEAVETYWEWLTYSYRYMESDIASPTMTPDLAQRVSYYITMNAADRKALNQRLDSFEVLQSDVEDVLATVTTRETWTFNYLSLDTGTFDEPVTEEYQVKYTVLLVDGYWRVQSVNADYLTAHDE